MKLKFCQRTEGSLTKVTMLTGIAQSDLCQIENGQRKVFPGWKKRLTRAFNLPQTELFPEDDERASIK